MFRRIIGLSGIITLSVLAAACGGSQTDAQSPDPATTTSPVTGGGDHGSGSSTTGTEGDSAGSETTGTETGPESGASEAGSGTGAGTPPGGGGS